MATPSPDPGGSGIELPTATDPAMLAFFRMLADAPDGQSVAHAISRGLLAAHGAEVVTIYTATPDNAALDLVGQWGLEPEVAHLYARLPMELPSPERDAFLLGESVFTSVRMIAADYPMVASYLKAHPAQAGAQVVYLPLRHRAVPLGLLGLRFHQPLRRTWALRETFDALTSGVTLWAIAHTSQERNTAEGRRRQREITVSNRQREVLNLVRERRTNADIARRLGYSEVTIKADLTALYKLLGASGRDDLVEKATLAGL